VRNLFQAFGNRRTEAPASPGLYSVLDIGTSTVTALVVELAGDTVVVRGLGHAAQPPGAMRHSLITDLEGVIGACHAALEEAEEVAQAVGKAVIVGMPAEQTRGVPATLSMERKHPAGRIAAPEVEEWLRTVQRQALTQAAEQLSWHAGVGEVDVRLINATLTELTIDGHTVRSPIGFQGKHVELAVFDAIAPLIHVGALQTLGSALDLTLVAIVAEPFALADCLLSPLVRELGAVYLDIGAGSTTVTVAREAGVTGYRSLPQGGATLTRALALAENVPWEEAEERKRGMVAGLLSDPEAARVRDAIAADLQAWISAVRALLGELSAAEKLPPFVYLCGGGSTLPGIVESLVDIGQAPDSPFTRVPRVAALGVRDMGISLDTRVPQPGAADMVALSLARQALAAEAPTSTTDELLLRVSRAMGPG